MRVRDFSMLAYLVPLIILGCAKAEDDATVTTRSGLTRTTSKPPVIRAITEIVNAKDDPTWAGTPVNLSGAVVYQAPSGRTFWLGGPNERVLVIMDDDVAVQPGMTVNVEGTLRNEEGTELQRRFLIGQKDPEMQKRYLSVVEAREATDQNGTELERFEPVPNFGTVWTAKDRKVFIGRWLDIKDAYVESVPGDKTFWMGPTTEERILCVLPEWPTGGAMPDSAIDIDKGQVLAIAGRVEAVDEKSLQDVYHLDPEDLARAKAIGVIFLINDVKIVTQSATPEPD